MFYYILNAINIHTLYGPLDSISSRLLFHSKKIEVVELKHLLACS